VEKEDGKIEWPTRVIRKLSEETTEMTRKMKETPGDEDGKQKTERSTLQGVRIVCCG